MSIAAMSIAVSVVVAPSRRLRQLLAGFGACLLAAAPAVAGVASLRFAAVPLVAAALLFAGACVLHAAVRPPTAHRIDVSGDGQLRLTVQQDVRWEESESLSARILPGTTLWPRLMLLRLGVDAGAARGQGQRGVPGVSGVARPGGLRCLRRATVCRNVLVLPDSLAPEAFRALAVALGAIAGRAGVSSTEHKIL